MVENEVEAASCQLDYRPTEYAQKYSGNGLQTALQTISILCLCNESDYSWSCGFYVYFCIFLYFSVFYFSVKIHVFYCILFLIFCISQLCLHYYSRIVVKFRWRKLLTNRKLYRLTPNILLNTPEKIAWIRITGLGPKLWVSHKNIYSLLFKRKLRLILEKFTNYNQ